MGFSLMNFKVDRRKFLGVFSASVVSALMPRKVSGKPDYRQNKNVPDNYVQNRETPGFYIRSANPFPGVDPGDWSLVIKGMVKDPVELAYEDLIGLPMVSQVSRLKCVECWSAKAEWRGFHFSVLQKLCPPQAGATGVKFHCADAYIEHLTLAELNHPRTLLVTHMDGEPLSDEHGFPLRIIAPSKYGYKNPKAILRIEYVDTVQYGTWSKLGPYSPDGTILPGTDHPLELGKQPHRIPGGEILDY